MRSSIRSATRALFPERRPSRHREATPRQPARVLSHREWRHRRIASLALRLDVRRLRRLARRQPKRLGAQALARLRRPGFVWGVIRRSNGPTMIIVNGEAQAAPPGGVMRGSVTLQADGRSVVLKPGQRYDPATGEVHEAAR